MAVLNFDEPPKVYGNGALDAVAAGLIALGEELKANVVAKKEAEVANIAKGNFIAKMSHELRTPLTTIVCSAELLLDTPLTDNQERLTSIMARSGALLLRIIDDILLFSNSEQDIIPIVPSPVNLETAIMGSVQNCTVAARSKGLELSFEYNGSPNLLVSCDELRLQQVLTSLLSNAIKFTEDGQILVKASTQSWGADEVLTLTIQDTGIGMDEETIGRAFEPFFSRDSSIRRKFGGAGLGMTISRAIIEAMGGKISIQSKVGLGTVVSLTLTWPRVSSQ